MNGPAYPSNAALNWLLSSGRKRAARHVPGRERGRRNSGADRLALERMLVVERRRRQRIVPDIGHAEHFEHGRGVGGRIVALHASGVQPGHVDALATEAVAELHVVRHELHMAEANSLQRSCNILRHGFVALPAARVAGLVEHGSGSRLVAAEDDCDAHLRHQPFDFLLQQIQLAAIFPCGSHSCEFEVMTRSTLCFSGSDTEPRC